MTRTAFVLLAIGAVVAGAVFREVTLFLDKNASDVSIPAASAMRAGPSARQISSPRMLPDLRFIDGTGAPRALADFRGRVVLLNLWATWCVPCRKEMPALDRLQKALGGSEFEVLALSLDQGGIAVVNRFFKELNISSLRLYVDQDGDALNKLGSVGIPLTILVDRDGRELWRVLGPREWDQPEEANRIRSHIARAPAN